MSFICHTVIIRSLCMELPDRLGMQDIIIIIITVLVFYYAVYIQHTRS